MEFNGLDGIKYMGTYFTKKDKAYSEMFNREEGNWKEYRKGSVSLYAARYNKYRGVVIGINFRLSDGFVVLVRQGLNPKTAMNMISIIDGSIKFEDGRLKLEGTDFSFKQLVGAIKGNQDLFSKLDTKPKERILEAYIKAEEL